MKVTFHSTVAVQCIDTSWPRTPENLVCFTIRFGPF